MAGGATVGAVVVAVVAAVIGLVGVGASADGDPLADAWERASESGSYRFRSGVEQTTTPVVSVTNVGRTTRVDQFHVEGDVDVTAGAVELGVWSGGGSLTNAADVEILIDENGSFRRGPDGEWVRSAETSGVVAPGGDSLAYLEAARDVVDLGSQEVGGRAIQRYAFAIDGSAFATMMADQTEQLLRSRGELARGATVQPSSFHRDATGSGELWVDGNGLPVRQVVTIRFPEQDGEVVSTTMSIDYFSFTDAAGSAWMRDVADTVLPWSVVLGLAMAVAWMAHRHMLRRGVPYRAIASFVGVAVFVPVGVNAASQSSDSAATTSPGSEAALDHSDWADAERSLLADPNTSLLTMFGAQSDGSMAGTAESSGVSNAPLAADSLAVTAVADDGTDTDGDGLTDFVERRIGTAWERVDTDDTDGDTLSDLVEVTGFEMGGVFWYPDPLSTDSNGDGIADSMEFDATGDGVPDDLDDDGVPDIFDDDNDGDGVPDGSDLSPFVAGTAMFGPQRPFSFAVDGLDSKEGDGLPLFVDVQLRPAEQKHLQFALEPMDWPADHEGQVRDVNDVPDDLQLVPLLEIEIPDAGHDLPADDVLRDHLVSVFAGDSGSRVAYVPLQLVVDDDTGARVAFSGRMPYLSQAEWGSAHSMRLVWAVQVANDQPCDPGADDAPEACDSSGYVYDVPQVVHRYEEEWSLTGLLVTQEFGTEVATIHEDPSIDPDTADHSPSWALAWVLAERFLNSVEVSEGVFEREIVMDDLVGLFDHRQNGGVTPYEVPDVFRVERASAPSLTEAIRLISETTAPGILQDQYDGLWNGSDSVRPLVLTASSSRTRTVGLDELVKAGPVVSMVGDRVDIDFDAASATVDIDTMAGVRWSNYCGGTGLEPVWSVCDSREVVDDLTERYGAIDFDPDSDDFVEVDLDPSMNRFQNSMMVMYELMMSQGLSQLVEVDQSTTTLVLNIESTPSAEISSQMRKMFDNEGNAYVAGIKFVSNLAIKKMLDPTAWAIMHQVDARGPISQSIGALKEIKNLFNRNTWSFKGVVGVGILVFALGVVTLAALAYIGGNETAEVVLASIMFVGQFVFGVAWPVYAANALKVATNAANLGNVLSKSAQLIGFTSKAAAIGFIVTVALAWGFFIYGIASAGLQAFSAEFNRALAGTIATTIFAAFMFALSLSIVGLIIVGVVAAIDGLLYLLCEYGGWDSKSDLTDGGCFTISGLVIRGLTALVYGYNVMVDAEADDLVDVGDVDVSLRDESVGYQVGNKVDVVFPDVVTTVSHLAPSPETWQIIPYLWFYSKGNLRSSTMEYTLETFEEDIDSEWDTMAGSWAAPTVSDTYLSKDLYTTSKTEELSVVLDLDTAGLNRSFDAYLNYGYAFPSAECWTVPNPFGIPPLIPICYKREFADNGSSAFDPRVYDVFPATLDEFIAIDSRPGGAWGLAWDDAFAALPDADFDGLRSSAFGGLDPDDRLWDTDGDGLSDAFEVEQQADGSPLSLNSADIDNDGLTDVQEIRLGTNPGVADTDNDGLSDGEEVRHLVESGSTPSWVGGWEVTVYTDIVDGDDGWVVTPAPGDVTVVVSSDPLLADGDADGIGDQAERQLAQSVEPADRIDANGVPYHPNVANASPFGLTLSTDDADGFVRPGQELTVRADAVASAALAPGVVEFDVPDRLGGPIDPVTLGFDPDTFTGQQSLTVERSLTVASRAASGPVEITADGTVRLPGGDPVGPTWEIVNEARSRDGVGAYSWVDLIAPDDASSDDFVITEMASNTTDAGGTGDVRLIPLLNGTPATLDDDAEPVGSRRGNFAYLRGGNDADTACTTAGECLTVWDHYDNCTTLTIDLLSVVDAEDDYYSSSDEKGIEPKIYLDRKDGQPSELLWGAGSDMRDNESVNPEINTTVCGDASLTIIEKDGGEASGTAADDQLQWTVYDDGDLNNSRGNSYSFDETTSLNAATLRFTDLDYREAQTGINDCGIGSNTCNRVDIRVTIAARPHYRIGARTSTASGGDVIETGSQFQVASAANTTEAEDRNPSVAVWTTSSNEELFWVTWERVDPSDNTRTLMGQILNPDGSAWGGQGNIAEFGDAASEPGAEIHTLGSRIDSFPVTFWRDRGSSTIWSRVGVFSTNQMFVTDATTSVRRETFDVAYDRFENRTVLVYEATGGSIKASLYEGSSTTPAATVTVFEAGYVAFLSGPLVEFVPMTGEWLVTAHGAGSSHAVRLSSDLSEVVRNVEATYTQPVHVLGAGSGLACPAWSSVPLADVRFDELPGASVFADSTRFGNDGVISGSVAAGVAGSPRAEVSDFAARFDSVTDSVTVPVQALTSGWASTVAFWYRTERSDGGASFEVGSGLVDLPVSIGADGVVSYTNSNGVAFSANSVVADGEWHHVAVSRDVSHNPLLSDFVFVTVFVDGASVIAGIDSVDQVIPSATIQLSGGSSTVDVDHVRVYGAGFTGAQVGELMARSDRANCLSVTSLVPSTAPTGESALEWARHFFHEVDVRGGRLDADAQVGVVIDGDLPVSSATLPQTVIANPGGASTTVVIGGSASDATSGIARVEVRVNNGAWQLATGAEAWSFPVSVTSGWYSVEVRAVDRAGNEQFVSVPQEFEVDGSAPLVLLDDVADVVRPETDPVSGARSLALSGSVLEVEPSSGLDRVEVQLTPSGSVPGGDGWQSASVSGGAWSVDYGFSADASEPVGEFVVRVRAVDVAGNVSVVSGPVVVDGAAPTAVVDEVADVVGVGSVLRGDVFDTGAAGVGSVEVSLTPLSDVVGQVEPDWQSASVDGSRWSYAVPDGVEDIVQVDVRSVDAVGNARVEANVWRGIVDTAAPRVSMTVTSTGRVNARGSKTRYRVVCVAEDRFLDEGSFVCPGARWAEPVRTFAESSELDALFPGLVGVVGLRSEYMVWASSVPSGVVSACDGYGNCSEGSATPTAPTSVLADSLAAAQPLVVDPTRVVVTSPVESDHVPGVVRVGFDAVTDDSFDRVEVLVDGVVVSSRSFAVGELSLYEASIAVPSVVAGERSVAVRVSTHDGQDVMSDPVVFIADTTPPVVTIDSTELDASVSWGPGTNMYVLGGTYTDDGVVHAVQVRIGDGPWVDAFFDAGVWRLALQIVDESGFSVSVRVTDRAGNTSVVDETGVVDVTPEVGFVRPDTVIDACVGCATQALSVTFELSAVAGSNDVSSFECELDGLPAVGCSSPWTVSGLATGQHSLSVTAIDDGGFRDLTPAFASWTVAVSGPQPVISSAPSDPSGDRTPTFVFSGPVGAVFGCSLDGEPFVVCSSPWVADRLGYGEHEFRVRATSGGVTGTPVAHRWSIVNVVPVAFDQTVFTTMDEAVDVVLFADDTDELSFRVVEAPRFGSLEGVAPDVVYVPFEGFVGFDSFTFEADDGQETSRLATVNVVVGTTDPPAVTVSAASTQTDPTNTNPVVFDIRFDQVVTGFGLDDVVVAGTAGLEDATVELFEVVPFREWTLVIDGVTGTGTVEVSVKAAAVRNTTLQQNPVSNTAVVVFDEDGPVVTITPAAGQSFLVGTGPFRFEVVFDEPVTGLTIDDFRIGGTAGIVSATLSGSGSSYVLTVPDSVIPGTITIELVDGAVVDELGNVYSARSTAQLIGGILPATGNDPLPISVATLLILFGVALLLAGRRRPGSHAPS